MKIFATMSLLAGLAFTGIACGDKPCDQLKDKCAACEDSTQQSACENYANVADSDPTGTLQDACQAQLDQGNFDDC